MRCIRVGTGALESGLMDAMRISVSFFAEAVEVYTRRRVGARLGHKLGADNGVAGSGATSEQATGALILGAHCFLILGFAQLRGV